MKKNTGHIMLVANADIQELCEGIGRDPPPSREAAEQHPQKGNGAKA